MDADNVHVLLKDGRDISVAVDRFDWLASATHDQRQGYKIIERGAGIWWDALGEGLSVPGLLGLPEDPPPDPSLRSYVVDYGYEGRSWIARVRDTEFSTFGRTLPIAKQQARSLLAVYLGVPDLEAAGVEVVDEVHSPEFETART